MPKRRSWWVWLILLGPVLIGVVLGWSLGMAIHTSSSPTPKITAPQSQKVIVSIPPDGASPAREVGVTIPGPVLDKIGPPPETSWAKIFEKIWPGVSTLLGALVGGGVTLGVGLLNNWHERRASKEARQGVIKDRSFNACVDVLKTGRLAANEANALWEEVYVADDRAR